MRLSWNAPGERTFESGVDRGVLYPRTGPGVPWNGLISVEEVSAGGEHTPLYFDGIKYLDLIESEDFQAVIESFGAPKEFARIEGTHQIIPGLFATHQQREQFDFSYRSDIGNDTDGENHGYKLHLVYNAVVLPSSKQRRTRGAEIEPTLRSWEVRTVPRASDTHKPTAHFEIDSTQVDPSFLGDLEAYLYGTWDRAPSIPTPSDVAHILSNYITEPLGAFI